MRRPDPGWTARSTRSVPRSFRVASDLHVGLAADARAVTVAGDQLGALPIHDTGRRAGIELLVVHGRFQTDDLVIPEHHVPAAGPRPAGRRARPGAPGL